MLARVTFQTLPPMSGNGNKHRTLSAMAGSFVCNQSRVYEGRAHCHLRAGC
jgi:hypothetical protein